MRYIVMPLEGWRSDRMVDFENRRPLREIARKSRDEVTPAMVRARLPRSGPTQMGTVPYAVLASLQEDGPKVLEMSADGARRLRQSVPSALVEPNQPVYAAVVTAPRMSRVDGWRPGPDARRLRVRVVDATGAPVAGARVLAFADHERPRGAARVTSGTGLASFSLPADMRRLARLQVEGPHGLAGVGLVQVATTGDLEIQLQAVDPGLTTDALGRWRTGLGPDAGQGVRIAVVDTGVNTAHPDLAHVVTRSVYSFEEDPVDPHPHANHVAGIIGARGPVFRGLAPRAELLSYRIAKLGQRNADAFHLGEGISRAAQDNDVHLINVSMVQKATSQFLAKAATEAFQNGAVCIGAAGNDGRDSISHPAAAKRFLAVTAFGDRSVLGDQALELGQLSSVVALHEPDLARATFSNWGPEADFTAPGVGLISCQGASGYAMDSGTSFAAPVVTGLAAAMLSKHYPEIVAMPKTARRAAAITQVLLARGRDLGFAFETQGNGIVDV